MATVVINHPELYPGATVVKMFALPTPRPGELLKNTGDPEGWKPTLTKLGTITASAGVLTITIGVGANELPSGKPALLWAEVGGKDVYLSIRAPEVAKEPV